MKIQVKEAAAMIFALVGNQNCGKTTLFNALTGSNQHVGNFPGVTVDQKTGEIRGEKDCSGGGPAGHLLPAALHPGGDRLPGLHPQSRSPTASSTSWTPPTSSATSI